MFDRPVGRDTSPGTDPHDCAAARLNAQRQAVRDVADWFEQAPDSAAGSFCTITITLLLTPCTAKTSIYGAPSVRAACEWTSSVASTTEPAAPPPGKTSAFLPSSRFTLLGDQYYEAAGSARGEDITSQDAACTDAQKKAHLQAMESAGKAGLCDQEDAAMRIVISFAPPAPALIGFGRHGISAFEAVCDWNLIIEAVDPAGLQPPHVENAVATGSRS